MLKNIKNLFFDEIAVDLGTANTLIYQKNKGIILNEPSVIALTKDQDKILAIGHEAKKILGKAPLHVKTFRPLRDGVIANIEVAEKMLNNFIQKIYAARIFKPFSNILICVPSNANQVDYRAIRESALHAGARKVFIMEEPVAAAIGAGVNVGDVSASMVVDIGGGTLDIAVISLNGVVYSSSTKIGGDRCDESIINYFKKNFGILIGEVTAEFIKIELGCACFDDQVDDLKSFNVRGRNILTGIPVSVIVTNKDLQLALKEPLSLMAKSIQLAIQGFGPEIISDLMEYGILLTGGGALLNGIDQYFKQFTNLPIKVACNPLTCVARGGGKVLEMLNNPNNKIKDFLI